MRRIEITENQVGILFFVLLVGTVTGRFFYPPIPRPGTVLGIPFNVFIAFVTLVLLFALFLFINRDRIIYISNRQRKDETSNSVFYKIVASVAHLLLVPVFMLVGLLLIWGNICLVNGLFDRSQPQLHQVKLLKKRVHKSSKSPASYLFTTTDWKNPHNTVELSVSQSLHFYREPGSTINIVIKRGFLGGEWQQRVY